jgi:hypothetical protein
MRGEKTQAALVDGDQHVHFKPVVVANDDGLVVHLVSGLNDGDRVALNLGDDVEDGSPLQIVDAPPKPAAPR